MSMDERLKHASGLDCTYCDCCSTRLGDGQTGLCNECLPDSPKQFTRRFAEHRIRGGRLPHNVQSLAGLLAAYAKAWDAYKEAKQ